MFHASAQAMGLCILGNAKPTFQPGIKNIHNGWHYRLVSCEQLRVFEGIFQD